MDKSVIRGTIFAPGAGKRRAVNGSEFPFESDFLAADREAMPFVSPNTDGWNPAGSRRLTAVDLDEMFRAAEARRSRRIAALEESRARVRERRSEERRRADASVAEGRKRTILIGGQYDDLFLPM